MPHLMYQLPEDPRPVPCVTARDIVEGRVDLGVAEQQVRKESA